MKSSTVIRPEIQALRAFAVLAVVIYHFWPEHLTGGYIGVDVFFVISGFLITGHLLREVEATGGIALRKFWVRRIRRLLPASFAVLIAVSIAVLVFVPRVAWQQFFREIGASALYIENWALASDSVDYMAGDNIPSPVQHFWSLGVEEQLYVALPILLVLVALAAGALKIAKTHRVFGITLAAVVVSSFVVSVIAVNGDDPAAYFATTGRAWEFALGGLLAWWGSSLAGRPMLGTVVGWAGWIGLAIVVLSYNDMTPFPGAGAVLPVVFTLAVLWAGSPKARWSASSLTALPPVQRLGDISYSMYLWHWPLIVLVPFAIGTHLTAFHKLILLAATVVISILSKRFIEDPFRFGHPVKSRDTKVFSFAAAGMVAVVVIASGAWFTVQSGIDQSTARAEQMIADAPPCFGAAALASDSCDPAEQTDSIVPPVEAALDDKGKIYDPECRAELLDTEVRSCAFGADGGYRVALIGDSHAASWFPAVERLAEQEDWELHTFYKSACAFSAANRQDERRETVDSCMTWNADLEKELAAQPVYDLVITSHSTSETFLDESGAASRESGIDGFISAWEPLIERGTEIVTIRDTPVPGKAGAACITENADAPSLCEFSVESALPHEDLSVVAAELTESASVIDLTQYFCADSVCPAVVGGVLVYRDSHHFTATYSQTLAPFLLDGLDKAGVL